MKKEFETPLIEIIYFDQNVNLLNPSNEIDNPFEDENVDPGGWV